jgi:hypothetical protein
MEIFQTFTLQRKAEHLFYYQYAFLTIFEAVKQNQFLCCAVSLLENRWPDFVIARPLHQVYNFYKRTSKVSIRQLKI